MYVNSLPSDNKALPLLGTVKGLSILPISTSANLLATSVSLADNSSAISNCIPSTNLLASSSVYCSLSGV